MTCNSNGLCVSTAGCQSPSGTSTPGSGSRSSLSGHFNEQHHGGFLKRVQSHAVMGDFEDLLIPGQVSFRDGSLDFQYSFGYHSTQGLPNKMEDRVVLEDLSEHEEFHYAHRVVFMAVFDGHAGVEAAEYLAKSFVSHLLASHFLKQRDFGGALSDALQQCELEFMATHCKAGSTALVALMVDCDLYVANVGDCRAVVSDDGEARVLTWDHKPSSNAQERERLQSAGALVSPDGYVQVQTDCNEPADIAISRALGGAHIKKASTPSGTHRGPSDSGFSGSGSSVDLHPMSSGQIVIPDADNFHYAIHQESEFLIMASDGVWDTVRNAEAVKWVRNWLREGKSATEAAQKLTELALKLRSSDNVTAVILKFSGRELPALHVNANSMLRRARSDATFLLNPVN